MSTHPPDKEQKQRIGKGDKTIDKRGALERDRSDPVTLEQLLHYSPHGVYLIDLTGTIVAVNHAGAEHLGTTVEQMIGTVLRDYFPDDISQKRADKGREAIQSGKPVTFEDQIEGRWYQSTIIPIIDAEHRITHLAIYGVNTTEYRHTLETLRKTESLYRLHFEHVSDVIYSINREFKLINISPSVEHVLGYTPEELLGRPFQEMNILATEYLEQAASDIMRVLGGERIPSVVYQFIARDGTRRWGEVSGAPLIEDGQVVAMVSVARDITERKQAEEALKENEEKYRTLVENSFDGIFVQKGPTIIFANQRLNEMLGYDEGELLGLEHWLIYHPDYQKITRERAQSRLRGEKITHQYEVKLQRKDGSWLYGEVNAKVINLEGEPGIQVWVRDITERKQSEEALLAERERFRSLSENAPFGMVMIAKDGTFTHMNPKFYELFGYDLRDIPNGRTWFRKAYPDPEYRHKVISSWIEDLASSGVGEKRPRVLEVQCKDGSKKIINFISVQVETGENLIACEDITDIKQAEEALKESKEKYRLLVENATDAIFIAQDELVKFHNPKTEEMIGYTKEELFTINFVDFIHPDDRAMVFERHRRRLQGEELPSPYSFRVIKKSGDEIWVHLNTVVTIWEGRPATLNFLRDITEQRRLESQLHYAQRMEALGTLAGGIAHDFNNLLMGIQGNASLMLLDKDTTHPDYEGLKNIEHYVQDGADLTKQLLGFARGGRYDVKPADLNTIVKKSSDMFGKTKKEITIHTKYQHDIWASEVDYAQIEQVLLNLYVNAWQAMPAGGEIYLETQNVTLDENYVKPFNMKPGRFVKIAITDTGVGMDEETQQRIFEPFFTTKEMGRGTGLGLASVYGIIKNHAGIINVYSEKGGGTTFTIYLPATENKPIEGKEVPEEIQKGTETILLVDDEEMILTVGQKLLQSLGYTVITARSGKEAIETLQTTLPSSPPDLVILDMIMPQMGGGKTYDRMKEIHPSIKVLLSSGYSINGQAEEILKRGCNGFIQKPFTMRALSQSIREMIEKE